MVATSAILTYEERMEKLRRTKLEHTRVKQQAGPIDLDDHGRVPITPDFHWEPVPNHPSGGFYGAKSCGANFRSLLEAHPVYINPYSSLAGGYMVYLIDWRPYRWNPFDWETWNDSHPHWNPDFDFSRLYEDQKRYGIVHGIGGIQHFAPDLEIGLGLGFGGLLERIRHFCQVNADKPETEPGLYDGLEDIVLGTQDWIARTAARAREMAGVEANPALRQNLVEMAEINDYLVNGAPRTFREACQWLAWYQMIARIYNGSGALGQLDETLRPFYERDTAAGILEAEEAVFHLFCLLLNDTQYSQIGGIGSDGRDLTSRMSYLILEAVHLLQSPSNIAVRVHENMDPEFLRTAVRYLLQDKNGSPLFMGDRGLVEGFTRNGYSRELARQRIKVGCHWCAIPGREYTLNDVVKINFARVFDTALREMMADSTVEPSTVELWVRFCRHLRRAVTVTADGLSFHLEHMWEVMPELVLDLLSHGPLEKGRDASHRGVEFYNLCIDGTALATVADSFAAIEQRVEQEKKLTWQELMRHLDNDWTDAEDVRLMMRSIPRYGSGGSRADEYAVQITHTFAQITKEVEKGYWFKLIPGWFSWANTVPLGKMVGATPNGRKAYTPINHGANPDPGPTGATSPTALAMAIASVQPGYGNTAPLQMEVDPGLARDEDGLLAMEALIRTHERMKGTQMNINVLNREKILEAHEDPSKYPDLVVRVTGFSAYFASLSKEFRQLVVDRLLAGTE